MRPLVIPFSIWLAALQLPIHPADPHTVTGIGELVSIAVGLAGLTVAVYRLGVWRQEMHNTKENVSAEVARHRAEMDRRIARIEERMAQTLAGSREPAGNSNAGGES
jgi:hypothetical protein